MTREEAKRQLEYLSVCSENHVTMAVNSRDRQAIEMAIKALEQPTEASCWGCNCPKMEMLEAQAETHDKRTETHGVCLDTISRNAAIEALKNCEPGEEVFMIESLPSAQPEMQAEVQEILQYLDERLHPLISPEHWSVYSELYDMVSMLPSAQPDLDEWCTDCKEYDSERHCCPRYNRVIREAVEEARKDDWIPCSKRLPEEDDYKPFSWDDEGAVIFCTKDGKVDYGWYYKSTKEWSTGDERRIGEVVAWMSPPESWKEEEK